jgi:hypothetical protein
MIVSSSQGRPASSSRCRSGVGEACCGADQSGANIEESVAMQIGRGRLLQRSGLGSLRRRRWLTAVAAGGGGDGSLPRRREKAALVAAMAAALGGGTWRRASRSSVRGGRALTTESGVGGGNEVVDLFENVTPNGPPRSCRGFFRSDSARPS